MEVKTDAIVLKTVDYKDNDKILTLFSPSLGRITAGAKGVKKPKAKLSFSAQPFCFAEYILAEKGGRYTVTGAYLHESFFSLRCDIVRFYAACAMAEVCLTVLYENEKHEGLFIALIEGLKALSPRRFHSFYLAYTPPPVIRLRSRVEFYASTLRRAQF